MNVLVLVFSISGHTCIIKGQILVSTVVIGISLEELAEALCIASILYFIAFSISESDVGLSVLITSNHVVRYLPSFLRKRQFLIDCSCTQQWAVVIFDYRRTTRLVCYLILLLKLINTVHTVKQQVLDKQAYFDCTACHYLYFSISSLFVYSVPV